MFGMQLLAIVVVVFGVWMSTHHDGCRRSLTLPVIGIGAVIFLMYALLSLTPEFLCILRFHSLTLYWSREIYLYLCALAVRSIIGFLGAMKNSSILLWIVSLVNEFWLIFDRGCFAVVRSCLFLDFSCAVSDSVVLHIGGNPGVHGISVSKHHLELNTLRNSVCTSYPIHLLSEFFFSYASWQDMYLKI